MFLQRSEINICSLNISAVLISPFCSSSCCQACFPSIVRPTRNLRKLTLEKILDPPELNCSVIFSLYCLKVSKKVDHFLRNLVRRERRFSWFNFNPLSFIGMMLGTSTSSLLCGFALIWMQRHSQSIMTIVLQVDMQEFLCCCSLNQSQIYLIHEKF